MKDIQTEVNKCFLDAFGRTPLAQRLEDILGEALELNRYTDLINLKEEAGDLLTTTLMLANECGWNAEELIKNTLEKIERRKAQYHSLGRKIKVAILGGAFNPVTVGHIQLAQYVLNASRTFDEVWLMPAYCHMYGKNMVDAEKRLEMCKLAASIDGRIRVSDYEIANKLSGETYHLVKRIQEETWAKDKYDFSFIIGLDNANSFDKWVNYEYLEKMIRFVIVPRQGVVADPKVTWYLKPPHIFLGHNEKPIMEISSTEVRRKIKANESLEGFVSSDVIKYISENKLYGE